MTHNPMVKRKCFPTKYGGSDCGGQSAGAASQIAKHLDAIPHEVFVEPFLGHGAVYRARKNHSGKEVLNDINCSQVRYTKHKTCSVKGNENCEAIKSAKISCGRDWKTTLKRYDGGGTLFYLDPPYEGSYQNGSFAGWSKMPRLSDIVETASKLKGAVAISYNSKPPAVKALCHSPFRCRRIKKNIFTHHWTELLAIKQPRGGSRKLSPHEGEDISTLIERVKLIIS